MPKWLGRFWNALRPVRLDRDLERELRFHVAERIDELREEGMSAEESGRMARLQFGNYTAQVERTRDMDISEWLDSTLRNLRLAARALAKSPAFSATVVLTLALGIGANSAVFSAINAVLLRPLPFPDGDRLVSVGQINPKMPQPLLAPARLEDWNRLNHTFQAISGYYTQDDSELSGELPEKLTSALVAPRFLQVWGVAPALGRDFSPQEEHYNGPPAVLISDRFWRRRFSASPGVIGKTVRVGRSSFPIIGVIPASFVFAGRDIDLWFLSAPDFPFALKRDLTWFTAIGRLKPGVTLAQARADLATVQADLGRQFPETDAKIRPLVLPLKETMIHDIRRSLWIVYGSVSLLLLIACINIAALILSRAAGRQHEIAVRFSLGASRSSVAAQLLTEVLLLAVVGAAAGLAVATAASRVFASLAKDLPRVDEIALDWRIVLYSLACAVIATLLCGTVPAIRGTRRSLAGSLAQAGRSQVSGRNPLQFLLVGAQVALAVTLLAGAGLLLRSFQELGRVSGGFDPTHVLTLHVSASWGETGDIPTAKQRVHRIQDALAAVPGVESAATTFSLPGVPATFPVELTVMEGRADTEPKIVAESRAVSPGYFGVMRIPLLSGGLCRDEPKTNDMMVNRSFANAYFAGERAVGRHLGQKGSLYFPPALVTGIVGDARERGLEHESVPTVYWCGPIMQPGLTFIVRTHGEPMAFAEAVRRKLHEIEPLRSAYGLSPLTDHISDAFAENRLRTVLLTFFALTAISLASVGLYGTLSYLVNLRQREVGLRLALGALRAQITSQFLGQGLRVSLLGCMAGLGLAAVFTRFLAGMLFGVSPWDALTMAGVIALVMTVSIVASLLPAIRASRVEPMRVLRDE
ncbi:MAG TPA: ABC transporter permease [Candidatus Sulfopaludibacter sp.]|nr:ABC transporter permease [Candidatus Sulfopaludibacter sp.]